MYLDMSESSIYTDRAIRIILYIVTKYRLLSKDRENNRYDRIRATSFTSSVFSFLTKDVGITTSVIVAKNLIICTKYLVVPASFISSTKDLIICTSRISK